MGYSGVPWMQEIRSTQQCTNNTTLTIQQMHRGNSISDLLRTFVKWKVTVPLPPPPPLPCKEGVTMQHIAEWQGTKWTQKGGLRKTTWSHTSSGREAAQTRVCVLDSVNWVRRPHELCCSMCTEHAPCTTQEQFVQYGGHTAHLPGPILKSALRPFGVQHLSKPETLLMPTAVD